MKRSEFALTAIFVISLIGFFVLVAIGLHRNPGKAAPRPSNTAEEHFLITAPSAF
jgi:hypothetical protein